MRFDRVPGPSPSAGFLTFAGNTEAKERLSACIDGGRLPHALLFEGPAGSGRRTLARLTAMAAVCTGEGEKPCGVCPGCRKAAAGSHPDILEAGGEGAARSFHIDTVRALREDAYILPNEAPRRVFLLAEAQNMTEQAQNALLKILEEPPASALFLLTCENRGQLLETIRSRVVTLSLSGVAEEESVTILGALLPDTSPEDRRRAAVLSGGVVGQALRGLSDGVYQRVQELVPELAAAVAAPAELPLLRLTGRLEKDREALPGVLTGLTLVFRAALVLRRGGAGCLSIAPDAAAALSQALSRERLLRLLETAGELERIRRRNANHTLLLTLLTARLRQAAGR